MFLIDKLNIFYLKHTHIPIFTNIYRFTIIKIFPNQNQNLPTLIQIWLKQLCQHDSKSTFDFCHPTFDIDYWSNFTALVIGQLCDLGSSSSDFHFDLQSAWSVGTSIIFIHYWIQEIFIYFTNISENININFSQI